MWRTVKAIFSCAFQLLSFSPALSELARTLRPEALTRPAAQGAQRGEGGRRPAGWLGRGGRRRAIAAPRADQRDGQLTLSLLGRLLVAAGLALTGARLGRPLTLLWSDLRAGVGLHGQRELLDGLRNPFLRHLRAGATCPRDGAPAPTQRREVPSDRAWRPDYTQSASVPRRAAGRQARANAAPGFRTGFRAGLRS